MGCTKLKGKERAELVCLEKKEAAGVKLCKEEVDRLKELRRRLKSFGD
ncbi:MAG: hypothetical protein ACD_25C00088G0002 [uncultured bacterium]|uniref:Uncharacterized protein n=1 Tax=candidate division WWE3 bacterium GW2011_GWC2_41_23 TaxID=1619123 RepID=A0A0G0VUM5_UNCKA|nr:MAG: hypothetical protein ACD_25C00088G0002 [uncultured bacterium]KKS03377.1 MAG: hypothetical protein UU55_C0003G0091 [candidate division WWE3 bacterium GW2011_GWC2_41_23]KKS10551.1 MAG: hypothetical protein UU64_C0003G0060 [candidate division WWE3 bacterium GW2011_GWF2_41_45]KKS20254.1 MAG: hypothetical protein UU79_C0002G0020 [candidate division WWE3 bacterium GW2011_GWE1_41_72]KKS28218.1 MAG: hypothetical protein UU90_C0033G0003 [candidate division WWE3 bacterium GW2011_GWD2_42_11]KKS28